MNTKALLTTLGILMLVSNAVSFGIKAESQQLGFEITRLNHFESSSLTWNRELQPNRCETAFFAAVSFGSPRRTVDELDDQLRVDPDVQALIAVREEMTQRAIDRSISIPALKSAYQAKDEAQIQSLFGFTDAQIKDLHYRLDKSRLAILKKFPEIENLMKSESQTRCSYNPTPGACKSDRFFDNFSTYSNNSLRPVSCRWGPYTANLALCSLAGPFWYWVCAYAATCTWCSGGWVDDVCG